MTINGIEESSIHITGWKLVLAGSRFTKPAETRYHPVEGEALAVQYALHKTRYFVLGRKELIITTDHRPLVRIFGDKELNAIDNPRLLNLKEKTLQFNFKIIHVPGKKNLGPDSMSRNPTESQPNLHNDVDPAYCTTVAAIQAIKAITLERVQHETALDSALQSLIKTIQIGFPECKERCTNEAREYFRYRDDLSVGDGIILYKSRILIPRSLRPEVLESLHSAHQSVNGMKARAGVSCFWPGIAGAITDIRNRCKTCNTIAPSQASEPPHTAEPPQFPFEQVAADYFELGGATYVALADRYSGWLVIAHFPKGTATASSLVSCLRSWFMTFGAPKEIASDGGPTFTSATTQEFLKNWGIKHRLSSVAFPHSNCRAELAVKTSKRMIRENTGQHGCLDSDRFARAMLQYRNTPLQDINLSPAQILLGRELRDFLPFANFQGAIRKEWRLNAEEREIALAKRHVVAVERLHEHTKILTPLRIGQSVLIQNQTGNNPNRWEKTGVIVESGPGPHQYSVRADGSGRITLRNRKFLKKLTTVADPTNSDYLPLPDLKPPTISQNHEDPVPELTASQGNEDTTLQPSFQQPIASGEYNHNEHSADPISPKYSSATYQLHDINH